MKINVHHIGGIGKCGHTESLSVFDDDINWTIYDANLDSLNQSKLSNKKNITLVNKCIGGYNHKSCFYKTFSPDASSVLKSNDDFNNFTRFVDGKKVMTWGDHTKIIEKENINLHSIDELVERKEISSVDFLSIDAQGLETEILSGAKKELNDNVVGVYCEVEFHELYKGQGLFNDIFNILKKQGFLFCDLYKTQYFNVDDFNYSFQGLGFLTVGEVLFFKKPVFDDVIRCMKTAGVAIAFNRLGFAVHILNNLKLPNNLMDSDLKYVKVLNDIYNSFKTNNGKNMDKVFDLYNLKDLRRYYELRKISVLYRKLLKKFTNNIL